MPGSPPTTPLLAIPRYATTDPDQVPIDLNAVSDRIDAAVGARLHDPGDLKFSARPTAAAGWLLCDGAAVSRTTYATLFAAIGTAYGAGNGSTTFNVPDLKGRAPLGAGTGTGLTARTRGTKLGTETISVADMPAHAHALTLRTETPGSAVVGFDGAQWTQGTNVPGTLDAGEMANTGGSAADGKIQPSTVVNVFIKT